MLIVLYVIGAILALVGGLMFSSKNESVQQNGKKLLAVAVTIGVVGLFF